MAKIRMNDNFDLDKFDPYKDTLVTTVRGTAEEVREVLDKLMGDETNKIKRNTVSLRQKWISVKERMPAKGEKVLLYIPERERCKQHGMYLGAAGEVEADPKGEHNFWGRPTPGSNWSIDGWSYFDEPIVTHWMPLPLCPEQEEDNDD